MIDSGVLPSQFDKENYFDFMKMWAAKPREDRTVSSAEAHRRMREGG